MCQTSQKYALNSEYALNNDMRLTTGVYGNTPVNIDTWYWLDGVYWKKTQAKGAGETLHSTTAVLGCQQYRRERVAGSPYSWCLTPDRRGHRAAWPSDGAIVWE